MAALSGLSFHRREGKRKCPIQESDLGWTSPGWSICCSLGWTTQTDLVGYTSEHCIPLGKRSCSRTAVQIHFLPATKGLINKKLNVKITASNDLHWLSRIMVQSCTSRQLLVKVAKMRRYSWSPDEGVCMKGYLKNRNAHTYLKCAVDVHGYQTFADPLLFT